MQPNNPERRRFIRLCSLTLLAGGTLPFIDGCTAQEIEADIQTVINDLPTAIQIAESIISIIAAFHGGSVDPNTTQQIAKWSGEVGTDLALAKGILQQYEMNLAGAPATVLGELDSAVADVNSNMQNILNAMHIYDTKTQAAVTAAFAAVDVVLLGLESIIPPAQAPKFPKTAAVLSQRRGLTLGNIAKATVPKPRDLAKSYNAKVKHDFPNAVVVVPGHWYGL